MNVVIAIIYFIRILYDQQLIKAYQEFMILYDICITLCAIYDKLLVQHTGDTFPILTDLDQLTNYSSMKLSSFLQTERNEVTIAGTFTRVDYP